MDVTHYGELKRDKLMGEKRFLFLPSKYLPRLALANCITIHRLQGSEYDRVHVILPSVPVTMLTSRLLYTAFTLVKNEVSIVKTVHLRGGKQRIRVAKALRDEVSS